MNMLERVARALWDAWILAWPQPTDEHGNLIDQSWESLGESGQRIFNRLAQCAIAEMRAPTDAILERVARALCAAAGFDPEEEFGTDKYIFLGWTFYVPDAEKALEALMEGETK